VIVLVVLLVLASSLDSPLSTGRKQDESTDACPRPVLFQSWMIIQIVRLTVCWSISCWVAVRANRRGRGEIRIEEEERIETYVFTHCMMQSLMTRINPTSPAGSVPSLTHSPSSSSDNTSACHSACTHDIHTTPGRPTHSSSSSNASIDMLSMMTIPKRPVVMETEPRTPEYARSRSSHSVRNSTLDLARASHLAQSTASPRRRRAGLATRFEEIAPK
jgi:hypothetical protein